MEFRPTKHLIDAGIISPLLAKDILKECPYDGAPILRNLELTVTKCMHPECRGHMKFRADDMLKYLGVKGIGPETCLTYIKSKGLSNHFQIIPLVFGDNKPSLHLWEVAMFCYVPGISTGWEEVLAGYGNFREFFINSPQANYYSPYRSKLEEAEKYFHIKLPLARRKIDVMITGSINGFSPRDAFIDACNAIVGSLIRIKKSGQKQSANYLICEYKENLLMSLEAGLPVTGKAEAAWKGGAKIVTSAEFLSDLHLLVRELLGINE